MKKKLVLVWIVAMILGTSSPIWALGAGTVLMPGKIKADDGAQWEYGAGFSPQLGITYRFNDKLSALASLMFSRLQATGDYQTADGKQVKVDSGKLNYLHLVANGKYNFRPDKMVKPYVTGGCGLYRWGGDVKAKEGDIEVKNEVETGISPGLNFGGGAALEVTDNFLIAGETKYHYLLSDHQQGGVLDIVIDFKFGF